MTPKKVRAVALMIVLFLRMLEVNVSQMLAKKDPFRAMSSMPTKRTIIKIVFSQT